MNGTMACPPNHAFVMSLSNQPFVVSQSNHERNQGVMAMDTELPWPPDPQPINPKSCARWPRHREANAYLHAAANRPCPVSAHPCVYVVRRPGGSGRVGLPRPESNSRSRLVFTRWSSFCAELVDGEREYSLCSVGFGQKQDFCNALKGQGTHPTRTFLE